MAAVTDSALSTAGQLSLEIKYLLHFESIQATPT